MGKILVLTDGKAGHENQSKAFARALGCDFDVVEVHFKSKFHKALSYLLDHIGIRTISVFSPNISDHLSIRTVSVFSPNISDHLSIRTISVFDSNFFSGLFLQRTDDSRQKTEAIPVSCIQTLKHSDGSPAAGQPLKHSDGSPAAGQPLKHSDGSPAADQTLKHSDSPPLAVLGTGSGTFYAAKAFAKKLGVKCGVVLYPRGYHIASFDCILAPAFDRPRSAPNVIGIPANLVAADAAFYEKGVASFREHYLKTTGRQVDAAATPVAVIIGGPNKCSTMTVDWMKRELDAIFSALRPSNPPSHQASNPPLLQASTPPSHQASNPPPHQPSKRPFHQASTPPAHQPSNPLLWVTTSRRTPADVEALVDSYPWDYKLIYSRDHFNPIPAFVSLAKRLYVTAESTGMLSEACTFGTAEVVPLDNLKPGPHKFRRFMEGLVAAGCPHGVKLDLSAQFAAAKKLMEL